MTAARTSLTGVGFGLALAAVAAYQQFKLPPALPVMLEAYGYDRVLAGGFMSVFAVAGIALSLRVGAGLERHGAWPYLGGAFALFFVGQALALAAPAQGWVMLVARGLEGVGFTVCAVAGPLIANMNASRAHLPLVVGLTAGWIPAGQIAATLVSLPVVAAGAWRPLWWVGAALVAGLAAWAVAVRAAPGADTDTRHGPGRGGGALDPARRRALVVTGAIFAIWSGQYFGYMTWLPQYLVEVHGLAADAAALAYVVPAAAVLVFTAVTGAALRAGVPLGPLFVGSIAVQVVVWFLVPATGGGALGVASLVAYGVTAGVTPACLFAMPSTIAGRMSGRAFGIVMTGRNLGVLAGPVVLAQVVAWSPDWSLVWPAFGTATLAAGVLAAHLVRRLRALG